jgi:hypothetical protein
MSNVKVQGGEAGINDQVPTPDTRCLTPVAGSVYALKGNNTRELWRCELPTTGQDGGLPLPADGPNEMDVAKWGLWNTELRICPNPVSDATTISFFLPAAENVSLRLCDAAGRIVRTVVSVEERAAECRLPTAGLSKGVYFLELNANGCCITRKLVLQ